MTNYKYTIAKDKEKLSNQLTQPKKLYTGQISR